MPSIELSVEQEKTSFLESLRDFVNDWTDEVETEDGQWTVKGFIDVYRNIYTISADTKVVSKILEIHLFPRLLSFAEACGYLLVLAGHQNYYPDISFVKKADPQVKFAVDFKTTYSTTAAVGLLVPETISHASVSSYGQRL